MATKKLSEIIAYWDEVETKQDELKALITILNSKIDTLDSVVDSIKDTSGIKKITDSLPAGANLLGKIAIDQTTDGTTNKIQARNATHDNFNVNSNLQIGDVDVGATNPVPTQLMGSNVEIGGKTYEVSGGDTLRGKSSDKPTAFSAHAVIPFCFYFTIDTGLVEITDGTNWVVI